ncbi:hypothetical protein [Streptosporangium sp. NPDC000509]|uniref:hypothetical protein n=1 Tax=Streptosporangium sp. NPDC000509 TaxID=3366186 RepID=UPI0036CB5067
MLKEACVVSALVAAALAPSIPSQAQSGSVGTVVSSTDHSVSQAPKCKWLDEGERRCYYCRGKKGSGYKKQYCERKRGESENSTEVECVTTKDPTTTSPNRTCKTCTDAKTGKRISKVCDS